MDNIKMMMLALFMQHKSEFSLWLFEKKKEKDGFEERLF